MKPEYKLLLTGFLAIGLFDALASIASRKLGFNYAYWGSGSLVIYCVVGFWGSKQINSRTAVLIAAAVGFFDSTIGWKISMFLKANTGNIKNEPTIAVWIITIIFVTGFGALCGLIGSALATYLARKRVSGI
ncbi:hypothetical protein [Mucilaginibacter paludis]|uniref:Uncharacterized protein n=1 Tax=Mucilaginibacter paludis DSM 18603 TaxID=714943 RepID=H1YIX6_9SPHI|nr:hypothetical protein [Mucilaginibacter paludis]EHQ27671.1 hypothetical protein Mucpa_3573 [Mucilaginibacter paludis DSM 18603]